MMSQYGSANPFNQTSAATPYGGYSQPTASMYGMGYGNAQQMMASQYGAAYAQSFANPAAAGPASGYGVGPSANAMTGEISRTIYLGNIPSNLEPHDILKCVHSGMVDSYRKVPEKNCAFMSFVDPSAAQMFYQEFLTKRFTVNGNDIKIGWGKGNNMNNTIKLQVQNGASRNVYLGRLTESDTEDTIRSAVKKFGPIECIRLIREKNIAFVHFLTIVAATKCVATLSQEPSWTEKRVNYGKDHCADLADQYSNVLGYQNPYGNPVAGNFSFDPYSMNAGYGMQGPGGAPSTSHLQRTLYIGNIHHDATAEDLCNVIRGGNLIQVRLLPEKHIAFLTFADAATAINVFNYATSTGVNIKGKRLRIGWGKPSTIPSQIALAVQNGATRNIYIGNIDPRVITIEKLREDFSEYGEIELINIHHEKNCAFVNFTSVSSAVTALSQIKQKPEYAELKINYGKDRCGNAWKPSKSRSMSNASVRKEEIIDNSPLSPTRDNETKVDANLMAVKTEGDEA
jgi:RNA recognition motif-containing protein